MSIHEPPPPAFAAELSSTPLVPHRFSVEQYHQMIELGILTTNDRVQLLQGVIAEMTPVGIPHSYSVQAMIEAIRASIPTGWTIRVQQPVSLAASRPELICRSFAARMSIIVIIILDRWKLDCSSRLPTHR